MRHKIKGDWSSDVCSSDLLLPFAGKTPILLVTRSATPDWDFTGGQAAQQLGALRDLGASEVDSPERLLAELRQILPRPSAPAASLPVSATG
jgi:hypothetical protein